MDERLRQKMIGHKQNFVGHCSIFGDAARLIDILMSNQ